MLNRGTKWNGIVQAACLLFVAAIGRIPAGAEGPTFVRGLNLNGPSVVIDGRLWEGSDSPNWRGNGNRMENPHVPVEPPLRGDWERMVRSSLWSRDLDIEINHLPDGDYQLFLIVWEDNASQTFSLAINGAQVVERVESGDAGKWQRLGPFPAQAQKGVIACSTRGGDANVSGVEVWQGADKIGPKESFGPDILEATPEDIAHFESKVRPLLIERCQGCHSHGSGTLEAGLALDSAEGWRRGGESGIPVLVPGSPDRSLMVIAVERHHEAWQMPPDDALATHEVQDLIRWIGRGAWDPRVETAEASVASNGGIDWEAERQFWSLQPARDPTLPEEARDPWCASPLDGWVLAAMKREGLEPAPDADRRTWLRRVAYDLTGLPPPQDEVDRFVLDESPDAHSQAIERYLASPEYGERWGRHWLDWVRYSDTAGDNSDFPIPQMVQYRNWVIRAFREDLPYDQFVTQQLAGDLMEGGDLETRNQRRIATGYLANARRFGSRVDDYPQHLTIEDTLDNLGRVFLASTINCARCHDHKFDPIPTDDYYGLYGIFSSTRYPWPGIELDQKQRDFVPLVDESIVVLERQRRDEQAQTLESELGVLKKDRDAASGEDRSSLDKQIEEKQEALRKCRAAPWPFPTAYAVAEGTTIGDARVHRRGDPAKLGRSVPRQFLTMLGGQRLDASDASSGRLALAGWLTDPKNPRTARVIVNRVWQLHFGRGLVETPNDFGRQGKPPSHPELLDWLANRLQDRGWSLKDFHRIVLNSRTYRQSSQRSADATERDPGNRWLSAYPVQRLDAESLRDTLLLLSGRLDGSMGDVHPFPPSTEWKFTQHNPFKAVYDTPRRSVYLMTQRIQRHPYLALFDGPDPAASTPKRAASTTPLQALFFLNSEFFHEACDEIARRIMNATSSDPDRLELLAQWAWSRPMDPEERRVCEVALLRLRHLGESNTAESNHDGAKADGGSQEEFLRWRSLVRGVLRSNVFLYLD